MLAVANGEPLARKVEEAFPPLPPRPDVGPIAEPPAPPTALCWTETAPKRSETDAALSRSAAAPFPPRAPLNPLPPAPPISLTDHAGVVLRGQLRPRRTPRRPRRRKRPVRSPRRPRRPSPSPARKPLRRETKSPCCARPPRRRRRRTIRRSRRPRRRWRFPPRWPRGPGRRPERRRPRRREPSRRARPSRSPLAPPAPPVPADKACAAPAEFVTSVAADPSAPAAPWPLALSPPLPPWAVVDAETEEADELETVRVDRARPAAPPSPDGAPNAAPPSPPIADWLRLKAPVVEPETAFAKDLARARPSVRALVAVTARPSGGGWRIPSRRRRANCPRRKRSPFLRFRPSNWAESRRRRARLSPKPWRSPCPR